MGNVIFAGISIASVASLDFYGLAVKTVIYAFNAKGLE